MTTRFRPQSAEQTMGSDGVAAAASIRLIGEITASANGREALPQSGRVAALLALLAAEPGRVVSVDHLMSQLWEDEEPQSGLSTLYVYVSRLRRQLEPLGIRLLTKSPGYSLDVSVADVDIFRFSAAVRRAEAAVEVGRPDEAIAALSEGDQLWRGEPFQNARNCPDLMLESQRLARVRDRAVELRVRCLLDRGDLREAGRLSRDLAEREPLNEAFWVLRMESESAMGNTGAALAVYEEYRGILAEALGIDPGKKIRDVHTRILREDVQPEVGDPPAAALPAAETLVRPNDEDLVGRVQHIGVIADALRGAQQGHGAVVILEGQAGVGKTFIAERAARTAESDGMTVAWTRAVESTGAPPLWTWQRILGQLPGSSDASGARELLRLREQTVLNGPADDATFLLADAIVGRVMDEARLAPLLIVIDDLQWADAPTQRAVALLGSSIRNSRCVVVMTLRQPEAQRSPTSATVAALTKETSTRRLFVPAFTLEEVREQVARSTRLDVADADRYAEELLERTGGNAFFLTELLAAGPEAPLPATITELIHLRVAELPEATRDLLEVAAIGGLSVVAPLCAVAGAWRLPEVRERLDDLVGAGLMRRDAMVGYAFVHSLARDAILESILPSRAVRWHAAMADAILEVYGADLDSWLEPLAYHRYSAASAGPDESAYLACVEAAERASAGLAFDQAALFRARAVDLIPRDEREPHRRAETLTLLTEDRRRAGDVQGASSALRQALRAAQRLGGDDMAVSVLSLLGGVTLWNWRQFGEVDGDATRLLETALTREDSVLSPTQRFELQTALAMELYYGNSAQQARSLELSALALGYAQSSEDPMIRARAFSARVFALWRPETESERARLVAEWAREEGPGEIVALLHQAAIALSRADLAEWHRADGRLGILVPRSGRAEYEAQYTAQLAAMAVQSGRLDEARSLIERTYSTLRRTSIWGGEWGRWIQHLTLARVTGDVSEIADSIVATATQEGHRALRWAALIALIESGRVAEAKAMQARWNMRAMPSSAYWGSDFEIAQAAEVALRLGAPLLSDIYAALSEQRAPLITAGTGLAVIGSRDELLARVADRLGRRTDAERHRRLAHRVVARAQEMLGVVPLWPIRPVEVVKEL